MLDLNAFAVVSLDNTTSEFMGNGDNQLIFGGMGHDTIFAGGGNNWVFGGVGEDVIHGGSGDDSLYGGQGDDLIIVNDGDNLLSGDLGNDSLYGGSGNDTMIGGAGENVLFAREGNNFLFGNQGNDVLYSGNGDDSIYGGRGNDVIVAEMGNNLLSGDLGDDSIYGGSGDDTIYGGDGNNYISGRRGNNLIFGNSGNDTVFAGNGNDTIFGGNGNNFLMGGLGDDLIYGEMGDDTLYGGRGQNTLHGGQGRDVFVLTPNTGGMEASQADVIADYTLNEDSLFLSGGLHGDRLEFLAGEGEFAGDTLIRDRETGEYLAVLKHITTPLEIEMASDLDAPNMESGVGDELESDEMESDSPLDDVTDDAEESPVAEEPPLEEDSPVEEEESIEEPEEPVEEPIEEPEEPEEEESEEEESEEEESEEEESEEEESEEGESEEEESEEEESEEEESEEPIEGPLPAAISSNAVQFTPNTDEATLEASDAQRLTLGSQTIYIGYWQKSGINQDPIISSFDSENPDNNWVRTDYESTGADGRGQGLFWDGTNLYATFSTDGTQGSSEDDWRRATGDVTQNWLRSYGAGGGGKVGVLGRIDPATGELLDAAFLSAVLNNGNSNSLQITDITTNEAGNLVVSAKAMFGPRNPNGTRMTQVDTSLSSPFDYTVEITPDLNTVISTSAVGWE